MNHQAAIAFSFALDLLRGWRDFSAKPKQSWISFNTQQKTAVWYCTSLRNTTLLVTPTEYMGLMSTSLERNGVLMAPSKRSLGISIDNCGNGFMMTASLFQRTNAVVPFHIWKLYWWYVIIIVIIVYHRDHHHYFLSYTLIYLYPLKTLWTVAINYLSIDKHTYTPFCIIAMAHSLWTLCEHGRIWQPLKASWNSVQNLTCQ